MHIIQRGNNRQRCFLAEADYLVYLGMLHKAAQLASCSVHAYVLMSNHVHVLATPDKEESAARMMKSVGERYVRYFNKRHERTGTLWDGRYKSCPVHDETYLMVCYRYVELNPVRAGIVADPLHYRWSSYHANAFGARDDLVVAHALYQALGNNHFERETAYRELVLAGIAGDEVDNLRDATNHNYACGNFKFRRAIAQATGHAAERVKLQQ
ncbi:transposase [Massilia sp. PAMC28688]|nr:transposase [Massilia sp. PAMC28688]QYF95769.1 transposase [Massilia sp. PAMC28688]